MEKYNVFDCSIIELDKHHSDRKGNLTVVQNGDILPFDVKRVYYLFKSVDHSGFWIFYRYT
mgnify:CR=1 FL=1